LDVRHARPAALCGRATGSHPIFWSLVDPDSGQRVPRQIGQSSKVVNMSGARPIRPTPQTWHMRDKPKGDRAGTICIKFMQKMTSKETPRDSVCCMVFQGSVI